MSDFSFNLIDQPWIPCIDVEGNLIDVSLHGLFAQAHQLRALSCETPIMNAAVMHVALAVLHRTFGPSSVKEWKQLWQQGHFPMPRLGDYFGQWRERFDLFHPERPFYQAHDERVKPKSVIHLIHSIGNTGTLFTHETEDQGQALTPAAAALHLITAQGFRTAGLSGLDEKFTDGALARGVLFFAEGESLFETLMLNLMAYPDEAVMRYTEKDRPAWEQDNVFSARNVPYGYLDYLTWQSNRVHLLPEQVDEGAVIVRMMTIAPGLTLDSTTVRNPQKRYERREDKNEVKWSFLYFSPDKALWRNYHSLIQHDDTTIKPPAVTEWLARLVEDDHIDTNPQLTALGMLADQAKPVFYRQEPMPLPRSILAHKVDARLIAQAVETAETVSKDLGFALSVLADALLQRGAEGKADSTTRRNLIQQWDVISQYWEQLEPAFWHFVNDLADGQAEAPELWQQQLIQTASDALNSAIAMAGFDPWTLKGGVDAERVLYNTLRKSLPDLFKEKNTQ